MGRLSRAGALVSACALGAALLIASPAMAAGPVRLGSAPAVPDGARIVSAVPATTQLHVTVTLQSQDPAGLAAFATEVSTPGSPLYRDYITTAEFAQRFGATPQAVQAVDSSLESHGLVPGAVSANSLSIPVTASAGSLSSAFATSFSRVALADGSSAIVNSQAPSLDSTIAPDVQGVLGLSTVAQAKPLLVQAHHATALAPADRAHIATGGPQPCAAASSEGTTDGGFTADQIAAAYGLSGLYQSGGPNLTPDQGAGQTVAILELESYDPNDITAFERCYTINGQPVNPLIANIPVDGGDAPGPGQGEAALDIENVISLAPQARIAVYTGPNTSNGPYDTMATIILQHLAQVVTTSWGQCEQLEGSNAASSEDTLFKEAAAQGMTVVSASGDDGSEDCWTPDTANANTTLQVDDPASQPFVTGVGGTSLTTNATTGARASETVWNDGAQVGASGGGISSLWAMPSYQSGAPGFLHVVNGNSSGSQCNASSGDCREVPDVSADGDPATGYVIYWNGSNTAIPPGTQGWQVVGGTSAAAPAWAALIALANASGRCGGVPIGFANPALYDAAASAYGTDFNDITSGNNDMFSDTFVDPNGGLYPAGAGYDMATGLGSPNGAALVQSLCSDAISLPNPGSLFSAVRKTLSLQLTAVSTRGDGVTYNATGLPSGLSLDASTGKVTGKPNRLGTSTVTVTATDAADTSTETTFRWTIENPPTLTHMSLSSVGASRPRLSFTVAAGRNEPALKSISIVLPRGLHFTKSRSTVSVTGPRGKHLRFTASLKDGGLVVTLRTTTPQARITISSPRLAASGSLTAALARHQATRVTLTVRVTDAVKLTTRLTGKTKAN